MSSSQGSILATVYTNVFEVISQSNYVAPRKFIFKFGDIIGPLILIAIFSRLRTEPTQLTQLFIRQGARMYAFESFAHNQPLMD